VYSCFVSHALSHSVFCLCSRAQLVVGSLDFVALNYYFPYVTSPGTMTDADTPSFFKDMNITRWVTVFHMFLAERGCVP
jgi:hypothetical protein